eukprot:EG_transcript_24966
MHVLEGYCLLFPSAASDFADGGVKAVLQEFFDFTNQPIRYAEAEVTSLLSGCLDALLAGCLKSPHAQQTFLEMDGPTLLLKSLVVPHVSRHLQQSILDSLVLLFQIIAMTPGQTSTAQRTTRYIDALEKSLGSSLARRLVDAGTHCLNDQGGV